jgi:hypothetical protein
VLLTSFVTRFSLDGVEVILKGFGSLFRRPCLKKLFIGGSSQVQSLESPVKEAMPRDGPQEHLESEIAEMD